MIVHRLHPGHRDDPVAHQADVQRGSPHIQRDEPADPVPGAEGEGPGNGGRRTGQQQPVGLRVGPGTGHVAAIGLHDQQRRPDSELAGPGRGPEHILADHGPEPRVDRGGRYPRVLTELAGHLG